MSTSICSTIVPSVLGFKTIFVQEVNHLSFLNQCITYLKAKQPMRYVLTKLATCSCPTTALTKFKPSTAPISSLTATKTPRLLSPMVRSSQRLTVGLTVTPLFIRDVKINLVFSFGHILLSN